MVFDAVGTVIHPDPPASLVYAAVGRRFGSRLEAAEIAHRFATAFRQEEERDRLALLRTSETREVERWRHIVAQVLDDVADPERCFRQLFDHFSRSQAWRCEPDTARVMDELARRGFLLGLASNYDGRLRSVVSGLPALRPVRHLTISSEVGWRKPAAPFFEAVCRQLDSERSKVLFVGDDRANDYDGSRAAGLQAILFDPEGDTANGDIATIATLGELLNVTE